MLGVAGLLLARAFLGFVLERDEAASEVSSQEG